MPKLASGRMALAKRAPYFASVLYSMVPVKLPHGELKQQGGGTVACDKYGRLYYDEETIEQLSAAEVATEIEHEIGHLLRRHFARTPKGKEQEYNLAGDMEINDDLAASGVPFWQKEGWIFPSTFNAPDRLTLEEYLAYLPKNPQGGGQGKGQGSGSASPGRDCGSVADGKPRPWEKGEPGGESADGTPNPHGLTPAEVGTLAQKVAQDMVSMGNCPAGWQRWANALVKPQVPWQQVLRGAIRSSVRSVTAAVDYTYKRPNRRSGVAGVILPSMHKFTPEVAIVVDTSGSMGEKQLAHALAEVDSCIKATGAAVSVLTVDAACAGGVQRVKHASALKLLGGGGTDMRVGITAALATDADVVVVITDCETPWPSAAPPRTTVVVNVGRPDPSVPAWAKLVEVK